MARSASPSPRMKGIPKLTVSESLQAPATYSPEFEYRLRYRAKSHIGLPHVVKFSGGRSSGMLLFALLENVLCPERGDVVVFNNTGAEHRATYEFVARCKRFVEKRYRVPFLLVEFQTYEDVRGGEWTRIPAYRLVNESPKSDANPEGYSCRGEPFEELISWTGYVPNQFRRTCTKSLKLQTTRAFLADWFAGEESIPYLGHYEDGPQVEPDALYRRHIRSGGAVPDEVFFKKREFALSRPFVRPEQRYEDFTPHRVPIENAMLEGRVFGGAADFGQGGVEYVAFIGLRADEPQRVQRVNARRGGGPEADGYEGEHVYMPLDAMKIEKADVEAFWRRNPSLDLKLPPSGELSNCVYCFLKGSRALRQVCSTLSERASHPADSVELGSPSDVAWWARIEEQYARDLEREGRGEGYVGFFGAHDHLTYAALARGDVDSFSQGVPTLPCDCTD